MLVIKKIDILSSAKLQAILMAITGLITGILQLIASAIMASLLGGAGGTFGILGGFGLFTIILFPILAAILGFISGAVGALFYNLIAGWVGGVKMDITQETITVQQTAYTQQPVQQ